MKSQLNLEDLKALIEFAKKQGIPRIKCGDFECEIPARDATKQELDAINKKLTHLESISQRLSMALESHQAQRNLSKPFTHRVTSQGRQQ